MCGNGRQIVMTDLEQKLADLNKRRKSERISSLCHAAARGEISTIKRIMKNGIHIDETDSNGRTALHCAASEGQLEAVRYLLQASASVNMQDVYKNTPLNDAVRHKHDQISSLLLSYYSSPLSLPGFEVTSYTPLPYVCLRMSECLRALACVCLALSNIWQIGVMMCSFAHEGDSDQLQRMIKNRVDVNTGVVCFFACARMCVRV